MTLKLVFNTEGTPVSARNSFNQLVILLIPFPTHGLQRFVPSSCTTAGTSAVFSTRTPRARSLHVWRLQPTSLPSARWSGSQTVRRNELAKLSNDSPTLYEAIALGLLVGDDDVEPTLGGLQRAV